MSGAARRRWVPALAVLAAVIVAPTPPARASGTADAAFTGSFTFEPTAFSFTSSLGCVTGEATTYPAPDVGGPGCLLTFAGTLGGDCTNWGGTGGGDIKAITGLSYSYSFGGYVRGTANEVLAFVIVSGPNGDFGQGTLSITLARDPAGCPSPTVTGVGVVNLTLV